MSQKVSISTISQLEDKAEVALHEENPPGTPKKTQNTKVAGVNHLNKPCHDDRVVDTVAVVAMAA